MTGESNQMTTRWNKKNDYQIIGGAKTLVVIKMILACTLVFVECCYHFVYHFSSLFHHHLFNNYCRSYIQVAVSEMDKYLR